MSGRWVYVLPIIMIGLNLAAAAMYVAHGDTRRAIYWLAAAVITASVTF